jgi:tripartite-type tricarboxylate transporter receptor subunit TctC
MQDQAKVLAIAAKKRISTLPNTPTFDELGVKGVYSSVIMGLAVAKGTSPDIINTVSERLYKMFKTNDALKQDLEKAGVTPALYNRDEAIKLVAESRGPILEALKEHGIKVNE